MALEQDQFPTKTFPMARTGVRGNRESSVQQADTLPVLPTFESLAASLKRIEESLAALAEAARGQPNQARAPPDDVVLVHTIPQAGKLLGLGKSSAYALAAAGKLPTITFGGKKVVPHVALVRLLEAVVPAADVQEAATS